MHWHRTYFAEIAFSFDGFQIKRISKYRRLTEGWSGTSAGPQSHKFMWFVLRNSQTTVRPRNLSAQESHENHAAYYDCLSGNTK